VQVPRDRVPGVRLREREVVPLVEALAGVRRLSEQLGVEATRGDPVGDADRDVVEHQSRSMASPKE
jgi:hypothetical protein